MIRSLTLSPLLFLSVPLAAGMPARAADEAPAEVLPALTVEAQRRTQAAVDVPISLRALTGDEVEARGIRDLGDAFEATPNTDLRSQRGGMDAATVSIRGVSSTAFGVDPAVAIYMDDVFIGSDGGFQVPLYDVEQIEILRGPQGTLYGRNALGGAVNLRSRRPDPEAGVGGYLRLGFGEDVTRQAETAVNLPLGSDAALRLSARGDLAHGRVDNRAGTGDPADMDDLAGRAQLLLRPGELTEVLVAVDHLRDRSNPAAYGEYDRVWDDGVNQAIPFEGALDTSGASLRLSHDLGWASVEGVTAWRSTDAKGDGGDFTASPLRVNGYDRDHDQMTQEVRLVSAPGGALDWTAGIFLLRARDDRYEYTGLSAALPADILFPGQPAIPYLYREGTRSQIDSTSLAGFGDVTWHAGDRLDLIVGARAGWDRREIDYDHRSNVAGMTLGAPAQKRSARIDGTDLSPRVGASWALTPETRVYATISRGYKAGGFNVSFAQGAALSYEPESAWNYEIGVKGEVLDGRLGFAASAFWMDWRDQQVYSFDGYALSMANAPRSRSIGAEVELTARPLPGLDLFAGLGLLDARFTDYPNIAVGVDGDGNRQPLASRTSLSLGAEYREPVMEAADAVMRIDWNWRSAFYYDAANTMREPAYGLVNLRTGIDGGDWGLFFRVANLFDTAHRALAAQQAAGIHAIPGQPRTVGIEGVLRF